MEYTPQRIIQQRNDFGNKALQAEFGKRFISYRALWQKASCRKILTKFPLYLQLELTPHCNLACCSCLHGQKNLKKEYLKIREYMEGRVFEKIINEAKLYNCPSISFHNNNEPLLVPDLEEKIKTAVKAGFMDIILVTNATLLTRERSLKLLQAGLTKISFSVDAFSKKAYSLNRANGELSRTKENIFYFLRLKKKLGYKLPITRITFVVNKNNHKEIKKFQKYWKDKVDMVEFQNFQALKGYTEQLCPSGFVRSTNFACNGPWQQVVIRANGDLLPCCSFYGHNIVMGNVLENSIYQLWRTKKMQGLRNSLLNGQFIYSACQECAQTFYNKSKH